MKPRCVLEILELSSSRLSHKPGAGFTLPAVLVVVAALLILAVGSLLVVGIERKTSRSFVDFQRAELAARAGLEEVKGLLIQEAANDHFLVIQSKLAEPIVAGCEPAPHLFIARGKNAEGKLSFRYVPLFSRAGDAAAIAETNTLEAPDLKSLVPAAPNPSGDPEDDAAGFSTLPYQDKIRVAWLPIKDTDGRIVARYAFWVEDLQGKLDPKLAGNTDGALQTHVREAYPFPAPGIDDPATGATGQAGLNQSALYAIDPSATEAEQATLGTTLIKNRKLLLSPDSTLAAAGIAPPLTRLKEEAADGAGKVGQLVDLKARSAEEALVADIKPYKEQPVIPYAVGIDPSMCGRPKLNLNALLGKNRDAAITEFSDHVAKALPGFSDMRRGGLPASQDYVRTLAANAFDYADEGGDGSVADSYRGLDSYPLISEIYLQVNFLEQEITNGRRILKWRLRLMAELWNMSNKTTDVGKARLSFEVDLHPATGIGAGAVTPSFDDEAILNDASQSSHDLTFSEGRFWTPEFDVSLGPDQYRFIDFATVDYSIDVGPASVAIGKTIELTENEGARGVSLKWNSAVVDRTEKVKRITSGGNGVAQWTFHLDKPKTVSKAAIPGHSYKSAGAFASNMGDPRSAYYLRNMPVDENACPENLSPNRRNLRANSIYNDKNDSPTRPKFYGRVLPSEWPDGGHDSEVGPDWGVSANEKTLPTDPKYDYTSPATESRNMAPQRISNRGCFLSAAELGNVFDPIMWQHTYEDPVATTDIQKGIMPANKRFFPDVISLSASSSDIGGGNTLRIGRPEHPKFDIPGLRAAHLPDLFHAGDSTSTNRSEREGKIVTLAGKVNLNTANRNALRALAAGFLKQDPEIANVDSRDHRSFPHCSPATSSLLDLLGCPTHSVAADRVADAIIASRPIASAAELSAASLAPRPATAGNVTDPSAVFGNRMMYPQGDNLQWSDAAAEEVFARVYESSTIRSRNFRVWVIGQAVEPMVEGSKVVPTVLAEVRKAYTVFADPGARKSDGGIDAAKFSTRVIYENDF